MRTLTTFVALCLAALATLGTLSGDAPAEGSAPSSQTIAAQAATVADWQLAHMPSLPGTDWRVAVFAGGLTALDGVTPGSTYKRAALKIAARNHYRLGPQRYFADDLCIGQAYADLYKTSRQERLLAALRRRCDAVAAAPHDGSLEFSAEGARDRWSWCDTLFMAPPAWARLYSVTGAQRYRGFLLTRWRRTSAYLGDADEQLFYRDSRFFSAREANGTRVFWARGNGWVLAGLAGVLQNLPAGDPARPGLERQFARLAGRILACQQADGLWRASLLDPASYPTPESSSTALFCYGMAWGVNHGVLERQVFAPAAERAWSGLVTCLTPAGRLTHVQPPAVRPTTFAADRSGVYASGAFLLAASEMYRLERAASR